MDTLRICSGLTEELLRYNKCRSKDLLSIVLGITKVYETATVMIGEDSLENGKTMGLSAYGTDQPFKNLFTFKI